MKKITYLEGIRGIAAFLVIFNHFMVAFFPATYWGDSMKSNLFGNFEVFLSQSPLNLFSNGNFAVCIFFILSGFVLSYSYFKTYNTNKVTSSAIKRYFRLTLPILFIFIIIALLMKNNLFFNKEASVITGSTIWLEKFFNFDINVLSILQNAFCEVPFNGSSEYLTVLWTITYELIGSFITYLFILLFGKMNKRYIAYIAYIAFIIIFHQTYYLAFILGILLSDLFCNSNKIFSKKSVKVFSILVFVLALYLGSYPSGIKPTNNEYKFIASINIDAPLYLFYHTIGAAMLIFSILSSNILQKILSFKPLVFIGEISFSVYLVHVVVLCSFSSYVFIKIYESLNRYLVSFGITLIISIPIIILISYIFEKIIVKNINKLLNYIEKKLKIEFNNKIEEEFSEFKKQ